MSACVALGLAAPLAAQSTSPAPPEPAPPAPLSTGATSLDDALADAARPSTIPLPTGEPALEDFPPMPGDAAADVPWPTVESTTDSDADAEIAGDVRYAVEVKGLAPLGLQDEYEGLSALWSKRGEAANLAQINRRTIEDRDLIDQLLRSVGHYGGSTAIQILAPVRAGQPTRVVVTVDPGPLYTFDSISITAPDGPAPTALALPLLGLKPGDTVDAVKVTAATESLAAQLADAGYPFAQVLKPDITIDHATRTAQLVQSVETGPRAVFGGLHINGDTQGFDERHLAIIARFKPGQPYSGFGRDDLRRALIQTGLFGAVNIKAVAAGPPNADGTQTVDLQITTEAAPVRTIAATGGYSTGQGIRVEASWAHRNLIKPEGGFTVRTVAAEREQVLIGELRRRNFKRRDQTLSLRLGLSAEQQNAFDATTFGLGAAIARESNIVWQKPWTYSLGVEALVTRQRDRSAPSDPNNTYFIIALPGNVTWDQSDNLLNPSKGFRLTARVSPEFTLRSGTYFNYLKTQFDGTAYYPLGPVVLAGRLHLGAIAGASRGRIAPDRRFYAGGGGSVRGFDYQGVGPKDGDGSPTGGNSLTEASAEVRYRFTAFGNDVGLVGFVDAGQVYSSSLPRFTDLRYGAGLGFRYYTSFGPVRIDLATPLTRQAGDPRLAFYVSIGQAF
ncbi:MAG: hypothetical protein CFE37_07255 [Alphaproteobacteria bacterium PA4]|nr:MAG: hypothetical protein CFE37_07255 [Alphaproteobacteria bacterium PA4]